MLEGLLFNVRLWFVRHFCMISVRCSLSSTLRSNLGYIDYKFVKYVNGNQSKVCAIVLPQLFKSTRYSAKCFEAL